MNSFTSRPRSPMKAHHDDIRHRAPGHHAEQHGFADTGAGEQPHALDPAPR